MSNTLYTFGYLSVKAEKSIEALIAIHAPLVDIRFAPSSRNWRYTQEALKARLGENYIHLQALGNELYKTARSGQVQIKLHKPEEGLAQLQKILEQHGRAAIFCACASKTQCHRLKVAELAQERFPVSIVHL